ncbi:TolC family protein [Ferruginibacter albus]|uniref:TolC family protein n=1 Tax=Ferruginibacter albus TaxID=2875540 RepID=UPI001CC33A95|nr:TolC family protein [Ferruginibacter albus]UAY51255.1 TolC family protein [Ferruginibacter albus]
MKQKLSITFFYIIISLSCFSQNKTLEYFINQAVENSPLLQDYQNQVLSATYDSQLVRAANKLQVNGSSTNVYAPVINGYGYDAAITNGGNYNALISVNKQLNNAKNISAQLQDIQLQNKDISNTIKISEQDLKRTIIGQYITTYTDQMKVGFNKNIYALLLKEDSILKKLTKSNVYKQVDYLSFLVTLQQQQLQLKQLVIQFKNDYATLNYLSGINDTSSTALDYPDISLKSLPDVNNSIFFKKFEIDSLRLVNNKAIVTNAYRAKINVFADAGYNSTLAYSAYKNFGTSFGISAIIPIYDGKQRKLQYNKITIQERTRQNYQSFFTKQYRQQVDQLLQQLNTTDDLLISINEQLRYSQSLIDVNEKLLEVGEVRITDYILALNNYINAKDLITQNNMSRLQIINQLNYWNR